MSLYSKAQADKALYAFPLDTTISDSWGFNALTTTYSTISAPTQTSDSKTGNAAYTFNGNNGITFTKASRTSPPGSNGNDRSDIQVEAVIKTSTAAPSGTFRVISHASGSFFVAINDEGKFYASMSAAGFSRDVASSIVITDGKWHHVVARWEGNVLKVYVDGTLRGTSSALNQQPTINDTARTIGYRVDAFEKFIGIIDFYADYASDYTGTLFDIADHALEVTGNNYISSAKTASSLFVQPGLSVGKTIAADPATASALAGNAQVSNFNKSVTLDSYLTSLSLPHYFKFDKQSVPNYGDGGNTSWFFVGPKTFNETNGPSNLPYVTADQITTTVSGGGSQPIWAGPIAEDDWTVGLWFRKNPTEQTILVEFLDNSFAAVLEIGLTSNGYLTGTYVTVGEDSLTLTGSTDLTDGQWHFAALTWSWETEDLKLYQDGSFIANGGLIGTAGSFNRVNLSGNCDITGLIVDYPSVLTEAVLDNIYDYGTQFIQGAAYMPQNVAVSISTAFYDYLGTTAQTQLKFDASGIPTDDGSANLSWGLNGTAGDITSGYLSKNIHSYKFVDRESFYETTASGDYSNDALTVLALFKVNPALMEDDNEDGYGTKQIIYGAPVPGIAPVILGATDTDYFAYISDSDFAHETFAYGGTLDDKYHLLGVTKNGSTFKFYIDGKLISTQTLHASIEAIDGSNAYGFVGGNDVGWFFQTAQPTEKYIDYVGTFNFVASPAEMFEMWQTVAVDVMFASNANLPLPVGLAGYGPVINPGVSYASALLVDPTQQDTVRPTILPMTVFATFMHPNYEAIVLINSNYTASPMTASGLFHMPQYQIGEINSVDHMNASATMPNHLFRSNDTIQANPFVSLNATLVMPGIVTIKGARIEAPALIARAILPLPPAYIQLTDDTYYNKLYAIHAQKRIQPAQSFGGAGIANQPTTEVAKSFLKFFSDVNLDITVGSTRYLTNEMPRYVYDAVDTLYYDNNGNILPLDTTKTQIQATAPAGSIEPTPILSKGYFDAWDRKAVNITNIEFDTGTVNSYHSRDKQYSLEFTFKTTKSNQVIAYGKWFSFYNFQRTIGTIGLFNGKIYSMDTFQGIGKADVIPHPANIDALSKAGLDVGYMLSNRRVDDGQWHHVVIQYGWDDNRTQFWIDGKLDKQLIVPEGATGSNGTSDIRPYVIGYNSNNPNLYSDFQTSVWSWIPQGFLRSGEVYLNYEASNKFTPIAAEPMLGSAVMSQDVTAQGNRGRALMLYWWPVNRELGDIDSVVSRDRGQLGQFDEATFDTELYTIDYVNNPPQQYYGWDVFPVDINGYYVSDLVKVEAYGGEQNIILQDLGGSITQSQSTPRPKFKVNRKGYFRDEITDARRYIDLVKDIDLSKFDAIFFRNYPDQSSELDSYARNEFSDTYFALQEKTLYEDFVKSVRAAVDTGVSLYVTNTQLAVDLGIIDGAEVVPDMYDLVGFESDPYAPTQLPAGPYETGYFEDTWRNNKLRVVNTLPGLTDDPTFIWKDHAHFENRDELSFGGPNRPFHSYEYRSNGLQVGDEFIYANELPKGRVNYQAVPFAKVKAGKIITAFANTVRRGLEEIENPYKNYATSIAVEPGATLKGSPVNGKIFVNFTERISSSSTSGRYIAAALETNGVDLIQDYWINLAYNEGIVDAAGRDSLLNSPNNLDRQLAAGTINQTQYNLATRWDSNGNYILSDATIIDDPTGSGVQKDGLTDGTRTSLVTKTRKNGTAYTARVTSSGQWFTFTYAWRFPRMQIRIPSMLTRGFLWISERIVDEGNVNRIEAFTATATMVHPLVTAKRDVTVTAPALVSSARIVTATGYAAADTEHRPVPFTAYASFGDFVKNVKADVMTASLLFKDVKTIAVEVDEVVVYLYHVDPIVYLREEVIK